jgi:long-subunit acyl-CoA synthetase (AMP-forming)
MEQITINGQVQRTWKTVSLLQTLPSETKAEVKLPRTFRDFILEAFEMYPDRTFISSPLPLSQGLDSREHVTFRQTLEQVLRTAAWMRSQGLGVGSKVAIGGGNSTEYVAEKWTAR